MVSGFSQQSVDRGRRLAEDINSGLGGTVPQRARCQKSIPQPDENSEQDENRLWEGKREGGNQVYEQRANVRDWK